MVRESYDPDVSKLIVEDRIFQNELGKPLVIADKGDSCVDDTPVSSRSYYG